MAVSLLIKVLSSHHELLPQMVTIIRGSLESSGANVAHFTLISRVCNSLSSCFTEHFIELFTLEIMENIDESLLVKVSRVISTDENEFVVT